MSEFDETLRAASGEASAGQYDPKTVPRDEWTLCYDSSQRSPQLPMLNGAQTIRLIDQWRAALSQLAERDKEIAELKKPREFRFYVSETCEEGERVSAGNILREIHDSMCMCGVWDDCDTEGVNETLILAAHGLLAKGEWSTDFEDGWIKVEPLALRKDGER